jgi:hypothetical protein
MKMRNYRFRVYFKAEAPTGARTIQPAIATRIHKLGEPFPCLGHAWKMVDACMLLGHVDADGVEICEGDIVQMDNNELGVVYLDEGDCSYVIATATDTFCVGFKFNGEVRHRVIGNRYTMPDTLKEIVSKRSEHRAEEEDED